MRNFTLSLCAVGFLFGFSSDAASENGHGVSVRLSAEECSATHDFGRADFTEIATRMVSEVEQCSSDGRTSFDCAVPISKRSKPFKVGYVSDSRENLPEIADAWDRVYPVLKRMFSEMGLPDFSPVDLYNMKSDNIQILYYYNGSSYSSVASNSISPPDNIPGDGGINKTCSCTYFRSKAGNILRTEIFALDDLKGRKLDRCIAEQFVSCMGISQIARSGFPPFVEFKQNDISKNAVLSMSPLNSAVLKVLYSDAISLPVRPEAFRHVLKKTLSENCG